MADGGLAAAKVTPKAPAPALPPVYPVAVIHAAAHALQALAVAYPKGTPTGIEVLEGYRLATKILHDGLLSHETAIKEGRSRG